MRVLVSVTALAVSACLSGAAMADHKTGHTQNNPAAPGQDRVCLVETSGGASGTVVGTKWLPRKAAEAQAGDPADPTTTKFVGTHPDVQTQEGCENFPT